MNPFMEAMEAYEKIDAAFDATNEKVALVLEATIAKLNINTQEAELKVMMESGTVDDLEYLCEAAEDGAVGTVSKAIEKIIDTFKQFIKAIKDKVVRVICNATTKSTLESIQKKIKLNPILRNKKVQVRDNKKAIKVIKSYMSKADKQIAKVKGGVFAEHDIKSISQDRDAYESAYKAAIAGTAALFTTTVAKLIIMTLAEFDALPKSISGVDETTSHILENFKSTLDKQEAAGAKAAYSAVANFRTKLAKDETNEHVDSIMEKIAALKKVVKTKEVVAKPVEEASDDAIVDELLSDFFESTDDAVTAESLLDDLDDMSDLI